MNEFSVALDYVRATLTELREVGVEVRASKESLAGLMGMSAGVEVVRGGEVEFERGEGERKLVLMGRGEEGKDGGGEAGDIFRKIMGAMGLGVDDYVMGWWVGGDGVREGVVGELGRRGAEVVVIFGGELGREIFGGRKGSGEGWWEVGEMGVMETTDLRELVKDKGLGVRRKLWEDMLLVLERMGRPITARQRGLFLAKG
jgi:hypothetical protein